MSEELIKISALPDADALVGNEYVPVVQGGVTKKALTSGISNSGGVTVKTTGDQTVAGVKTFTSPPVVPDPSASGNPINKGYFDGLKTFQTLVDGATITWNVNDGLNAEVTLGGNRTLAITNAVDGDSGLLIVNQDGTGSRTLTLPSGSLVLNGGSGLAELSSTASAKDIIAWVKRGSVFIFSVALNAN